MLAQSRLSDSQLLGEQQRADPVFDQIAIDRVALVSDDDIRAAQLALWDKVRVVAEPGGAAAFGALLSGKYTPAPDERVAVMVSGANTTAVKFD